VVNELKARGVNDILIAVVDGLKGFPEAITSVFPQTVVQTCIVHLMERSQGDPALDQGHLPGRERRHGAEARGVRGRVGQTLSGDWPGLAPGLGACRAILCLRARRPQNDLHDKHS
jgi:hypothetical protein